MVSTVHAIDIGGIGKASIVAYDSLNTKVAVSNGRDVLVRDCSPGGSSTAREEVMPRWDSSVVALEWMEDVVGDVLVGGDDRGALIAYRRRRVPVPPLSAQKQDRAGGGGADGNGVVVDDDGDDSIIMHENDASTGDSGSWIIEAVLDGYSTAGVGCIRRASTLLSHQGAAVGDSDLQEALVAVGYRDGMVRVFSRRCADIHDAAAGGEVSEARWTGAGDVVWDIHSSIHPRQRGMGPCTSLEWRPGPCEDTCDGEGALPLLLICGYQKQCADVYLFRRVSFSWEWCAGLVDEETRGNHGQIDTVIAWAPLGGRSRELVASANGNTVILWGLQGPLDKLEVEEVARLEHDSPVWHLGWNMTGSWLAASTKNGEICLWRADLSGEWLMLQKLRGKQI